MTWSWSVSPSGDSGTTPAPKESLLGSVTLEALGKLPRTAESRGVSPVDLVGGDAQALMRDATEERSREQTIVATEHHPCRDVRPCPELRRLTHSSFGLLSAPTQRLGGELRRNVLIEELDR